jgi:drug/metabolite transporter (DMT)-like permease
MRLSSKFIFLLAVLFGVSLEVLGDYFIKRWAVEDQSLFAILGLVIYFIGSLGWMLSLKYESLSKAATIFMILNLLAIVFIGVVFFKEHLTWLQRIGIAFGIMSIALIEG